MATHKRDDPGNDLAVVDAQGTVIAREGDVGLGRYLSSEVDDVDIDSTMAYKSIITEIMTAESAMDVLTPPELTDARTVIDRPFQLTSASFNESEYEAGATHYVSLHGRWIDNNQRCVVNCGHQALMAQVIKLMEFGPLDYTVAIIENGKPNRFGNTPLRLKVVDG